MPIEKGGERIIWIPCTQLDRDQSRSAPIEEVHELYAKMQEGIRNLRDTDMYREYLEVMSRLSDYSFRNTMLIMQQYPEATMVGSFSAWMKLGRQVKNGEQGIRILLPVTYFEQRDMQKVDQSTGLYVPKADGIGAAERKTVRVAGFRPASVYDVSQTEGREIPRITQPLTGSFAGSESLMKAIISAAKVKVQFGELKGGTNGLCDTKRGIITIRMGMSEAHRLKVLLHEVAHWRMHPPGNKYTEAVREVQAESLAYVVGAHFGLDTSDYTFGYLDSWMRFVSDNELKNCVDIVSRHASTLIDQIERELGREKGKEIGTAVQEEVR